MLSAMNLRSCNAKPCPDNKAQHKERDANPHIPHGFLFAGQQQRSLSAFLHKSVVVSQGSSTSILSSRRFLNICLRHWRNRHESTGLDRRLRQPGLIQSAITASQTFWEAVLGTAGPLDAGGPSRRLFRLRHLFDVPAQACLTMHCQELPIFWKISRSSLSRSARNEATY